MPDEELEFVELDDELTLPDGEEPKVVTEPRPPAPPTAPASPEMTDDELEAAAQQFLANKGYQVSRAQQQDGDDDWEARIKREAVEAARKTILSEVNTQLVQNSASANKDALIRQASQAQLTDEEMGELRGYLDTLDAKMLHEMATQSQGVNLGWIVVGKRTADARKSESAKPSMPSGVSAESHGVPPQKRTVTLTAEQNKRWDELVNVYCGGDKAKATPRMREAFLEAEGIK